MQETNYLRLMRHGEAAHFPTRPIIYIYIYILCAFPILLFTDWSKYLAGRLVDGRNFIKSLFGGAASIKRFTFASTRIIIIMHQPTRNIPPMMSSKNFNTATVPKDRPVSAAQHFVEHGRVCRTKYQSSSHWPYRYIVESR